MSPFEFYFSFYGLLLGLSAATLVVRFADVLGEHGRRRIGLLAPLLGVFVLLDLSSFWIFAWRARESFEISYIQMYFGLLVAVAYFIAASLVFPREGTDWTALDDHYWARKIIVLLGIMAANFLVLAHAAVVRPALFSRDFAINSMGYWPVLIALLFTRKRAVDIVLLGWLSLYYVGGAIFLKW